VEGVVVGEAGLVEEVEVVGVGERVCKNLGGMVGILWERETRITGWSEEIIRHIQMKTNSLIPILEFPLNFRFLYFMIEFPLINIIYYYFYDSNSY